ncbi:Ig-like domain-containing protein [Nocardioides sp.]|uniref:Ig-like domain-containing protein n=1 Tax=Nocardioides sp. TaxID=35761 RepID=UPI002719BE9D|nr:Ig-like domain-containing protein [Nocardioides sp.]MDO9455803.1 hypothetical protein [Nocardioides sp.]
MPRRHQAILALAGLGIASLVTALPAAPASADRATDAPVTMADRLTIRGGAFGSVDVLRNDSDPDGDPLEICRVDIPDGTPLVDEFFDDVETGDPQVGTHLALLSTGFEPGTYTVTYYACDLDYLTPGTLTVTVTRTRPVRVRKVAPHVVRFANPDNRFVRVSFIAFGPEDDFVNEGSLRLRPGQAKRVRVEGRRMFWSASAGRSGNSAGEGLLRGLHRG